MIHSGLENCTSADLDRQLLHRWGSSTSEFPSFVLIVFPYCPTPLLPDFLALMGIVDYVVFWNGSFAAWNSPAICHIYLQNRHHSREICPTRSLHYKEGERGKLAFQSSRRIRDLKILLPLPNHCGI